MFTPTPHPVLGMPSPSEAMALGERAYLELMARREKIIADEKADPFARGWEPPIWKVCDALLGFPWVEAAWAARMRAHLGFAKPVSSLLINGGQRGGKSEFAAKRQMRLLRAVDQARGWALHSKNAMSVDYQQPLFWKYMHPDLRTTKGIRTNVTYVAYKKMTGFAESKFVLPNSSDLGFLNYEMDMTSIEGGNLDFIWPDELVPADWVETMELRIAEKDGRMVITFTPVQGYTETVKLFQDGATIVRESIAFCCPKDGGPPDPARALGLTEEELEEIKAAAAVKPSARAARCPQARPEDCNAWLEGKSGQMEVPPDREFEKVPRVMKCCDPEGKRAVVFFHSSDNPYGNPKNVWATIANKSQAFIKERFYGVGNKLFSCKFPKFNTQVHVVSSIDIPTDGMNTLWMDPCDGRNFFMLWIRVTADGRAWVYREWPGNYYIEGIGVPGPWALASGKKYDGKPGPAQTSFGFGYRRYKEEIARLEGWKDAAGSLGSTRSEITEEAVRGWLESNGSAEDVRVREADSRFASTPKVSNDEPVTLLEEMADWNLFFDPTPGDDIGEGVISIQNALDYDEAQPISFFNKPKLLISSECHNLIFAMQTWTGQDGQKGACKDPIDCLRYFLRRGLIRVGGGEDDTEGNEGNEGVYTGRETASKTANYY